MLSAGAHIFLDVMSPLALANYGVSVGGDLILTGSFLCIMDHANHDLPRSSGFSERICIAKLSNQLLVLAKITSRTGYESQIWAKELSLNIPKFGRVMSDIR